MTLWQPIDPPVWERAGGIATTTELYDRAHRAALFVDNVNSRVEAWEAVYDRQIDQLAALTGTRLENPFRVIPAELPANADPRLARTNPGELWSERYALDHSAEARAAYAARLAEMRAANPSLVKFTDINEEAVNAFIRGTETEFLEAFHSVVDQPGMQLGAGIVTLAAGITGMLRDPVQAPLFLFGGGPGASRLVAVRILTVGAKEAAIGGISEAALQPFIQRNRAIAGLPHGFQLALANVLFATGGGFAFGGTLRGAYEGFRAVRNMIRPARPAANPARAAETVEAPPEVRGALDALENEVVFAAARPGAVGPDAHERAMSAAIRAAEDPTQLAAARAEIDEAVGVDAFAYEMRRAIQGALIEADMAAARAAPRPEEAVGRIEAPPEAVTVRAAAVAEAPAPEPAPARATAPETPPAPAARAETPARTKNIIDFLIDSGGLRPNSDLAAIGAGNLFRPGRGKLVRKAGAKGAMDLDRARELAAEAGYFGGDTTAAIARTTPADLLDLLDDAIRGKEVIPDTAVDAAISADTKVAAERAAYLDRIETEIGAYMQAAEIDDRRWLRHAVQITEQSGLGPNLTDSQIDDIMERAAILMAPAATRRAIRDDIPFDTEGQPARSPSARRGQGREDRRQAERAAVPDAGRDQSPPAPELGRRPSDKFEDADAVAQADALEASLKDRGFEQPAWHGSPFRFDRFSTGKIGTGEGAQAYGWGLYFAGRREIADYYRANLTRSKSGVLDESGNVMTRTNAEARIEEVASAAARGWGQDLTPAKVDEIGSNVYEELVGTGGAGIEPMKAFVRKSDWEPHIKAGWQAALDLAGRWSTERPKGRVYKVDIPEDDVMLLWDKPFREQSPKVKEALATFGAQTFRFGPTITMEHQAAQGIQGESMYRLLAESLGRKVDLNSGVGSGRVTFANDQAASLALRDAGIMGVKYLDAGSRSQGEGSYNYVIFDDRQVSIAETFEQKGGLDAGTGDLFSRPARNDPTPRTRPADKEPTRHVDLGNWDHDLKAPLGSQAQDYVLKHGRASGVEYMVALNGAGDVVAHGYGTKTGTGMTAHLWEAINKPGARVVVHHNHPSGSTLSTTDLTFLPLLGQESVWAHGDTGRSFHASLTPEARVAFNRAFGTGNPEGRMSAMRLAADFARDGLYRELRDIAAANPKLITVMADNMQELINSAMDAAGIIVYRSDGTIDRTIDANGWRPHVERAAASARKVIFRGEQLPARVDRRAEPLRHLGDMGAVFSRPEGAAGRNLEQGGPDRVGKQDARSEGGTGFREDSDPGLELEDGTTLRAALAAASRQKFISTLVEACRLR